MKRVCMIFLSAAILLQGCKGSSDFVDVYFEVRVPEETGSQMLSVTLFDAESGAARGGFFMSSSYKSQGNIIFTQTESLKPGVYSIVAYTMDAAHVEVKGGDKLATMELTTRPDTDSTLYQPGVIAAANLSPAVLGPYSSVGILCKVVTTTTPVGVGVGGGKSITTAKGVARGFATSYFPADGNIVSGSMIGFEMTKFSADSLAGAISSFGVPGGKYDLKIISVSESTPSGDQKGDGFTPEIGQWNDYSVVVPI